jgi:hypothetical protein
MEILKSKEEKDGSLTMEVQLTPEELEMFVNVGINKIITDHIEKEEELRKT